MFLGAENTAAERQLQPFKTFSLGPATHQMASIRLPDMATLIKPSAVPLSKASTEEERQRDEEVFAKYGYGDDEGAGMGKLRLNLVKLGCWVNVDAPLAVSCQIRDNGCHSSQAQQVAAAGGLLSYLLKQYDGGGLVKENGCVELTGVESVAL